MIPDEVIKVCADATGAITSEIHAESCVLVGDEWVLGVAHGDKDLSNIISNYLSFDLAEGISSEDRQHFSLNPIGPDGSIKIWQISKSLQVGLFHINPNIKNKLPSDKIKIPDGCHAFNDGDAVFAVGYPFGEWMRKIKLGSILRSDENKIHAYAHLKGVVGGFSGGPLFSEQGKLLGIIINNPDPTKNIVKFTRLDVIFHNFDRMGFLLNSAPTLKDAL